MKNFLNIGEPPSKTKYNFKIDSEEYREGKMKYRSCVSSEKIMKLNIYKQSE